MRMRVGFGRVFGVVVAGVQVTETWCEHDGLYGVLESFNALTAASESRRWPDTTIR